MTINGASTFYKMTKYNKSKRNEETAGIQDILTWYVYTVSAKPSKDLAFDDY